MANPKADRIGLSDFVVTSFTPGHLVVVLSDRAVPIVEREIGTLIGRRLVERVGIDANGMATVEYDSRRFGESEFLYGLLAHFGMSEEAEFLTGFRPPKPARTGKGGRSAKAPVSPPTDNGAAANATAAPILSAPAAAPVERSPYRSAAPAEAPAPGADRWTVKSDLPGRLRLQHPYMCSYPSVVQAVESRLTNLDGIVSFAVNAGLGTVLVQYDPKSIGRDGIVENLTGAVSAVIRHFAIEGMPEAEFHLDRTPLQLTLSTVSMLLAGASFFVPGLRLAAVLTTAVTSSHIVISATKAIVVERRIKVDILDATVIILALAYRHVIPAAIMVWVVDVSNVLLDASSKAQRRTLAEMFGRQVRKTWRMVEGTEVECLVSELQKGDVIVVRSGEQLPVDGIILEGEALVDQSALTGEHAPAERGPSDRVFAMSVVLTGKIQVTVSETGENTNAARMVKIIEQSFDHKVDLQSLTETFADVMVVPTLSLGGLGYAVAGPGAMMAVINADFGTGIRIAGPLAMLSSLSVAAKNGILIKKGRVLEKICKLDAVVFDKTGTLTEEVPTVERVVAFDGVFSEDEVLAHVAAAEQRFKHPIARAILNAAATRNLELPAIEEADYRMGFGIQVRIGGKAFTIGSMRFMENEGIAIAAGVAQLADGIHGEGGSTIFVAADGRLVGLIELQASPRPEAHEIIQTLREKRGISEIYLISGDHEAPTRNLARRLGIDKYFAEVLPQDKAKYVKHLQDRGLKVAMIGDGINDTVGLAQADYSISLRGAADAATDIADVVFMDGNFAKFDLLFEISENLEANVKRSFVLTLVPNSVCIVGALAGVFGLGSSLILNNAFNLVSTANGLRAQSALQRRLAAKHEGPAIELVPVTEDEGGDGVPGGIPGGIPEYALAAQAAGHRRGPVPAAATLQ